MRRIAAALTLAVLATACSGASNRAASTKVPVRTPATSFAPGSFMAALKTNGKIRIGVKYDLPQFGYFNPVSRKVEGFDVEFGKLIAGRLGVASEFVETTSANRIPFLNEDKVDLVISTMTINAERRRQIDFSDVYYVAGQSLLVKKGSPIRDVAGLNSRKGSVCTSKGSTSAQNIAKLAPDARLTQLDTYSLCFAQLRNGQVDAVTTDDAILLQFVRQDPNYALVGGTFSREPYGMGIKKGRGEFVAFVNDVIATAKANGTWTRLYNTWVRPLSGRPATPPPKNVEAGAPAAVPSSSTSPARPSSYSTP